MRLPDEDAIDGAKSQRTLVVDLGRRERLTVLAWGIVVGVPVVLAPGLALPMFRHSAAVSDGRRRAAGARWSAARGKKPGPASGQPPAGRSVGRTPKISGCCLAAPAHPALVSEADFVAAQKISAVATPKAGPPRDYLLAGVVVCDSCAAGRVAGAYNRPAYRCRHGHRAARSRDGERPFHVREDRLLTAIAVQLYIRTGEGQTLWPDADIAAYLRTHKLSVRCTRDAVVIVGMPAPKSTEADAVHRSAPNEQLSPAGHGTRHYLVEQRRPLEKRDRKRRSDSAGNAA